MVRGRSTDVRDEKQRVEYGTLLSSEHLECNLLFDPLGQRCRSILRLVASLRLCGRLALRFQSHSACCVSACFLRSALNLYCRFVGIHRRDGGHGLTFVYFLKDVLGLNVVVRLPCGPGRRQTLRCV